MPHLADIDLTVEDISRLASVDALAAFFNRLGYPTGRRKELTVTALGLGGETAEAIRSMELLAEDDEQFLRVVFVKLRSITAKACNDLARNLGRRNVEQIMAVESSRGEIARAERSALDPQAQPLQDLLDHMIYRMAGLTDADIAGLEKHLARML
jgi:hypothetical protein